MCQVRWPDFEPLTRLVASCASLTDSRHLQRKRDTLRCPLRWRVLTKKMPLIYVITKKLIIIIFGINNKRITFN